MGTFVKKQPVEPVVPVIADGILPSDWELKTIAEICEKVDKIDPTATPNAEIQYIDIGGIDNQLLRIVDTKTYLGKDAPSRARQLVKANDVVISTVRTYLKNIALVPDELDGQVASTGFCVLRSADPWMGRYLYYFVQSEAVLKEIAKQQRGTSYPAVRDSDIKAQFVPVPPKKDCKTIVEAIELQLGRLDAAVARLHAAKAKLKRYRQAVLKAAVEGRLTNPDIAEGNLPEGWRQVAIKDIAELLNGDRGKNYPSSRHYVEAGVPFINTGHIEPNGQLSQERMNHITRERFNILNAGKIVRGDIVYCLRGATLGKTAIVDFDEGAIASSLMIIRLRKDVSREFIYYYLTSDLGRRNIADYDNGTAQPNLSAKSVGKYLVPLPPFDEQLRIVEHVGVRLNQMQHMETTLDVQLSQATRLRQSVLKRAFEGRLVAADVPVIKLPTPISIAAEPPAPYERTAFHRVLNIEERAALNAWVVHVSNKDHTLGRTKAEKIEHMIEGHVGYDHQREPLRDAAGPIDLMSRLRVEETMTKMKWAWVEEKELRGGKRMFLYHSGPSVSSAVRSVEDLLGDRLSEAERIVKAMRPLKTARAEVVATLYAAWNDLLHRSKPVTDRDIMIEATTEWHEDKMEVEYSEWVWGLRWLREHGLTPTGNAKLVKGKPKK